MQILNEQHYLILFKFVLKMKKLCAILLILTHIEFAFAEETTSGAEIKEPISKKEKVGMYLLNVPTSFVTGFIGFGVGIMIGAIFSLPVTAITGVCRPTFGPSGGSANCSEAGLNTTNALMSVGGSIGTFGAVYATSKAFGLKHKFWHTLMGSVLGIIPFSYYYYRVTHRPASSPANTSNRIDGSSNPHLDYGSLSAVFSALLFTYIGSIYHEFDEPKMAVKMKSYYGEQITEMAYIITY